MFENEYKMDIRRYQRWTTPIFYKVLSFWPWLFIFLLSTVGAITARALLQKRQGRFGAVRLHSLHPGQTQVQRYHLTNAGLIFHYQNLDHLSFLRFYPVCLMRKARHVTKNHFYSVHSDLPCLPMTLPLGATATTAASGGNREELLGQRPAGCERERSRCWEPQPGQWHRAAMTERFNSILL